VRRKRTKADRQALALVREVLSADEFAQLRWRRRLDVPSPNNPERIYRIPRRGGFVWVFERGVHVMWVCVQPTEPLPEDDVVLMHRTMIQADEEHYLASSNCFLIGEGGDAIIQALARQIPVLK
jgi:hypothetical protein